MSDASRLLSKRLLAGNVLWSLAGAGLPLLVGLWAIPVLIEGMGKERFGLLAIIWMGIGYFSLFDLGIGRALTKLVAEGIATEDASSTARLITVGLRLMLILGAAAGVLVASLSALLVDAVLKVPPELRNEASWALWILAATLPFVVSTSGLIGILQAHQRFKVIAAVRVPLGAVTFAGPALIMPLTHSLVAVTAVLAASRALAWLGYRYFCRDHQRENAPVTGRDLRLHGRRLIGFGGWITVSNIVGPIMVYFDRFFVGALVGLSAVAFYATPYEIISRVSIIPTALAEVIFPAFALALAGGAGRAQELFSSAYLAQLCVLVPIIAAVTLFAQDGLAWWVGDEFSQYSAPVLRWLALGVFINGFARLPLALLQANHRPDIAAKIHLAELPIYILALYWLTLHMGIVGTAIAWTFRVSLDAALMFYFSARIIPEMKGVQLKAVGVIVSVVVTLAGLWSIDAVESKAIALMLIILASVMLAWFRVIRPYVALS